MYRVIIQTDMDDEPYTSDAYGTMAELCKQEHIDRAENDFGSHVIIQVHMDGTVTVGWAGGIFAEDA